MRTESGGYRRDQLRALAQRVEVDAKEVRIMGSKSVLLRTLVAASSAKTAGFGVPSFVPKWRSLGDSNPCFRRERARLRRYLVVLAALAPGCPRPRVWQASVSVHRGRAAPHSLAPRCCATSTKQRDEIPPPHTDHGHLSPTR